jgi:hypothetical protein
LTVTPSRPPAAPRKKIASATVILLDEGNFAGMKISIAVIAEI